MIIQTSGRTNNWVAGGLIRHNTQMTSVKWWNDIMMTSSNGNIFRVTGPLCGEFTGPGEFLAQRPVTRSFDAFFDLRPNKRLSKQLGGWWFETQSWSLWRHCNDLSHESQRGKSTTVSALDGVIFDFTQMLTYLVHNMSRSKLYLGFGHFDWFSCFGW